MLRKRSRLTLKDQMFLDDNHVQSCDLKARKSSSFFSIPDLFVSLSSKVLPDSESAKSPTSPLDFKLFSTLSNTFSRSPRSSPVHPNSWDYGKVGLGLVNSLKDLDDSIADPLGSSDSKKILLSASQMKVKIPKSSSEAPRSLPNDCGMNLLAKAASVSNKAEVEVGNFGRLRSYSADCNIFRSSSVSLCRGIYEKSKSTSEVGTNITDFCGSLSASEIELSEDYTCIVSHGPNPKITHIFGDNFILESDSIESPDFISKFCGEAGRSSFCAVKSSHDLLSFCSSCKNKLEEGKDIYMYRGEKAFCSRNCREQEFLMEEMEKTTTELSISPAFSFHDDDLFLEEMTVPAQDCKSPSSADPKQIKGRMSLL